VQQIVRLGVRHGDCCTTCRTTRFVLHTVASWQGRGEGEGKLFKLDFWLSNNCRKTFSCKKNSSKSAIFWAEHFNFDKIRSKFKISSNYNLVCWRFAVFVGKSKLPALFSLLIHDHDAAGCITCFELLL